MQTGALSGTCALRSSSRIWIDKLHGRIAFAFVHNGVLVLSLQPNPFCLDTQSALAYKLSNPLTSRSLYSTIRRPRSPSPLRSAALQSPQIHKHQLPSRSRLPLQIRVSPAFQLRLYPSFVSAATATARNHREPS